jgi:hypothetical protein
MRPPRSRYRILEQAVPSMLAPGTIHMLPYSLFSITLVGATTPAFLSRLAVACGLNELDLLTCDAVSAGRVDNDIEGKSRHISCWRASGPLCAVRPRMPLPMQECR